MPEEKEGRQWVEPFDWKPSIKVETCAKPEAGTR